VVVFLKNAWVSESAYVVFRSIEQLMAGNGPRWNPHERVQSFSSPLWFWMLAFVRLFSRDAFLNALSVSLLCSASAILALKPVHKDHLKWGLFVLLLLLSNSFFDYTSSGLEHPLGYLMLAAYLYLFHQLYFEPERELETAALLAKMCVLTGLFLVFHIELLTLICIPTLFTLWYHRKEFRPEQWACLAGVSVAPLLLWVLFSLVYYGSPFSTPVLAELNAGLTLTERWAEGGQFLLAALGADTITPVLILASAGLLLAVKNIPQRLLGLGLLFNLVAIVFTGADAMIGRYLAYPYLFAAASLVTYVVDTEALRSRPVALKLAAGCLAYLLVFPHNPIKSTHSYDRQYPSFGATDERGLYYLEGSLWKYLNHPDKSCRPPHALSLEGCRAAAADEVYFERERVGYFGFWAGLDKIIIGPQAPTDPLLARLPLSREGAAAGQRKRALPEGYLESLKGETPTLPDPALNAYYEKLRVITQGEALIKTRRLRTIWEFNLGRYDHLLEDYTSRNARYQAGHLSLLQPAMLRDAGEPQQP
jgi:arabinofuranosyltransferase